jgi:hypothetical protein
VALAEKYPPCAHNKNIRLNPGLHPGLSGPYQAIPPPGGVTFTFSSLFSFQGIDKKLLTPEASKDFHSEKARKALFLVQDQANPTRKWPENGVDSKSNFFTPFDPLFRGTAIVALL